MQSFRSSCTAKIRCPHFCVQALLRLQAYGGRSPTTCRAKASKLEAIDKISQGFLQCSLHWICCRFFSMHAGCGLIWASQALFPLILVIFLFFIQAWAVFTGPWQQGRSGSLMKNARYFQTLKRPTTGNKPVSPQVWDVARLFSGDVLHMGGAETIAARKLGWCERL